MERPKQHNDKRRSVLLALVYRNPVIDCYLHLVCRYLPIYRLTVTCSSNYIQANQMQTVLQLLAMTDSQPQDLHCATTQINTIQQNFPGLNLANAASMVTSQQQVVTPQPVTGNSQVNFLTQLLNASTQQAPSGSDIAHAYLEANTREPLWVVLNLKNCLVIPSS